MSRCLHEFGEIDFTKLPNSFEESDPASCHGRREHNRHRVWSSISPCYR